MQRFQSVSDIAAEDTEIARMAMQRFQSVSDIAAEDADFQQPLEALHGGQPTDGDHLPELQRSKSVDTLLDDRTTVRGAAKLEVEEEDHSSSPDDTDDGCSSTEQHQKPTDVLDGDCLEESDADVKDPSSDATDPTSQSTPLLIAEETSLDIQQGNGKEVPTESEEEEDDTDDGSSSTEQHQKPTDVLDGEFLREDSHHIRSYERAEESHDDVKDPSSDATDPTSQSTPLLIAEETSLDIQQGNGKEVPTETLIPNEAGDEAAQDTVGHNNDEAHTDNFSWTALYYFLDGLLNPYPKVDEDPSAPSTPLVSVHSACREGTVVM
eukprot:GHVS01053903.1.p1 GENE.GHVS01053903.1~~GHVS01053903.1.p1  ORF type:complete len:323 (+),score=73.01 GHVS01053903.1:3-971(+)